MREEGEIGSKHERCLQGDAITHTPLLSKAVYLSPVVNTGTVAT